MALTKQEGKAENDLGFGNQAITQRIINRDGSINVKRTGQGYFSTADSYHQMITMSWSKFWLIVLSGYLLVNILFALIYVSLGPGNLDGMAGITDMSQFLDAFFFSAQTMSTVGYGHISPVGVATNTVAAFESMIGLLAFALATGLLYGRFSLPTAKIMYSERMLVAPYRDGINGIMFRLANKRRNLLIDLRADVTLSFNDTIEGKIVRKFMPLKLERCGVQLLTLSWTVVHPLDDDSPLKDVSLQELQEKQATFNIILKAFDDTFSQTVQSRTSYQYNEMVWGGKFTPTFFAGENGQVILDLSKLSSYQPAELN
ncbi:ion channel [Mucilaginibacter koreensis]